MTQPYQAMCFAREKHKHQKRKYTGNPYSDHLAEVAGIVATVCHHDISISVAWLHDVIEDQGVTHEELKDLFGVAVADGVMWLTDTEEGSRATRKKLACERLSNAPAWIQTVKVADLISNTSSIVQHDPKFAVTYLAEKRQLLSVLKKANPLLLEIAWKQTEAVSKDNI